MSYMNMLGDFVHRTSYADLPKEVIDCAKSRFIDFLSIAFSGYRQGFHKPFLKIYQGSAGNHSATVIGEGINMSWMQAALVNSSMCDVDIADGSRFASLHPGLVVFPSALATFEAAVSQAQDIDGKDLLTAIALGYEVMIRIGRAMVPSSVKRGFHNTAVVGALGSAATAGKLLNLESTGLTNALSIAAILGAGLFDAFKAPVPYVEIQTSRSCESGILAAALAQEGVQGNDEILEKAFIPAHSDEYNLESIEEGLSDQYLLPKTYLKIHGGCRHLHSPTDAMLTIVNTHKIRWDDIEKIKIKTYSLAKIQDIANPQTGDDGKFNMAFGMAVALIRGNTLDQFTTQNLKNESIQDLMKRVVVETSPDLDKAYPAKRGTIVEVTTKGGKVYSQARDLAKGEPEFPLTREEIEGKFKQLTAGLIPEARAFKIINFIDTIEDRKSLHDLFAYLKVEN